MNPLTPATPSHQSTISWSPKKIAVVTAIVVTILTSLALFFNYMDIGGLGLPIAISTVAFTILIIGLVLARKKKQLEAAQAIEKLPSHEAVANQKPATEMVAVTEAIVPELEPKPEPEVIINVQIVEEETPPPSPKQEPTLTAPPHLEPRRILDITGLSEGERIDFVQNLLNNTPHFFKRINEFSDFAPMIIFEKIIGDLDNKVLLKMESHIKIGLEENPDAVLLIMQKKSLFFDVISKNLSLVKDRDKRDKFKEKIKLLRGYDSERPEPLPKVQPAATPASKETFSIFAVALALITHRNKPFKLNF